MKLGQRNEETDAFESSSFILLLLNYCNWRAISFLFSSFLGLTLQLLLWQFIFIYLFIHFLRALKLHQWFSQGIHVLLNRSSSLCHLFIKFQLYITFLITSIPNLLFIKEWNNALSFRSWWFYLKLFYLFCGEFNVWNTYHAFLSWIDYYQSIVHWYKNHSKMLIDEHNKSIHCLFCCETPVMTIIIQADLLLYLYIRVYYVQCTHSNICLFTRIAQRTTIDICITR